MFNRPISIGPGPSSPQTNFKQAYLFTFKAGTGLKINVSFNTTWVSYVYLFDANTHRVMFEFTNDNGATSWSSGVNKKDLQYGILNYHKVNVSPGNEHANDQFFQSELAMRNIQQIGSGEIVTIGFSDGHGRSDNALVQLRIANDPLHPIFDV